MHRPSSTNTDVPNTPARPNTQVPALPHSSLTLLQAHIHTVIFLSHAYGIFSRIYDILGHKTSLGKFKKTEIVSSIFSDHNAMRLDINYRKKSAKNTNRWSLNNTLLNNEENTKEIKKEIKKYLDRKSVV